MDLRKVIESLRREKERLDRVIALLEELEGAHTAGAPPKKRRGRKSMSHEERLEVSERMKKYWSGRRKKPQV
jgi:hypothetical protein